MKRDEEEFWLLKRRRRGGRFTADAASFDGALDWLGSASGETTTPLLPELGASEVAFTYSSWLNFPGSGSLESLLSIASGTNNRLHLFSNAAGNLGIVLINSGGTTTLNVADTGVALGYDPGGGGGSIPAQPWVHLYVTYDASNNLTVYRNRAPAYTALGTGGWQGNLPLRIGARGSAATNKFGGIQSQTWFHNAHYPAATTASKFYAAPGVGKNLGADGSRPTGVTPLIYLPYSNDANLGENAGASVDLPLNGAPTQTTGITVA